MKKLLTLALALTLIACSSEEEQKAQQEQQIQQQAQQIQLLQQQVAQQQAQPVQEVQQVPVQQPTYIPQPVAAPAPVVVQSAPQHDSTMSDMLVGGLVGHAIGSSLSGGNNNGGSYHAPAPVVNRTYVTKVTKVYNRPKPTASKPMYRKSNIGRYRK
jgi:type II secretory pathway pseudopilin PulG